MFKIKGEHYYNDFTRSNYEKTFESLEDIFTWLAKVSENFSGDYSGWFTSAKTVDDFRTVSRIEANDYNSRGYEYWIYEIANENGIVFATGNTTNGHSFCADKVKEWLIDCQKKMKELKDRPNFVQM